MEHQIKQLLLLLQAPVLLIAPFFAFSIQSERVCPLPEYECAQVYYYYCYYLWSPFTSIDREAVVQKKEEIEMQSALHEIGALPALSSNLLLVSRRGKWPEIFALFSLLLSVDKLITYRKRFLVKSLFRWSVINDWLNAKCALISFRFSFTLYSVAAAGDCDCSVFDHQFILRSFPNWPLLFAGGCTGEAQRNLNFFGCCWWWRRRRCRW